MWIRTSDKKLCNLNQCSIEVETRQGIQDENYYAVAKEAMGTPNAHDNPIERYVLFGPVSEEEPDNWLERLAVGLDASC